VAAPASVSSAAISTPPSNTAAAAAFPWPSKLSDADTDLCKEAESRVKAGVALLDQVWLAATCVLHRLPEDKQAEFATQVHAFRDAPSTAEATITLAGSNLPAPLDADFKSSGVNPKMRVDVYVADAKKREELKNLKEPHLGMGSWRGICLPWQDKAGHSDVTRQALDAIETQSGKRLFSSQAKDVLTDASQDADFFAWTKMAAHAQTDSDANGRPKDREKAQDAFISFVKEALDKAKAACVDAAGGDLALKKALYWTGYSVHALQDLAPHRGRTNPEHSYNANHGKNPDVDDDAILLAKDLTVRYLSQALSNSLAPCAARFATYKGGAVTPAFKWVDLKLRYDNTPASLIEYKQSAALYEKIKGEPNVSVRWFGGDAPKPTCAADAGCKALFDKVPK
jgi:hypothetical protein